MLSGEPRFCKFREAAYSPDWALMSWLRLKRKRKCSWTGKNLCQKNRRMAGAAGESAAGHPWVHWQLAELRTAHLMHVGWRVASGQHRQ